MQTQVFETWSICWYADSDHSMNWNLRIWTRNHGKRQGNEEESPCGIIIQRDFLIPWTVVRKLVRLRSRSPRRPMNNCLWWCLLDARSATRLSVLCDRWHPFSGIAISTVYRYGSLSEDSEKCQLDQDVGYRKMVAAHVAEMKEKAHKVNLT